jgi:hypothetical protein
VRAKGNFAVNLTAGLPLLCIYCIVCSSLSELSLQIDYPPPPPAGAGLGMNKPWHRVLGRAACTLCYRYVSCGAASMSGCAHDVGCAVRLSVSCNCYP